MAKSVVAGIGPKGMNENIHIRKYHGVPIRSSRSLDRLRSTPGNVPPDALETGNRTRVRRAGFASARTLFSPSSTREVSVRPCSAAFFLALRSSSSESLIVVLICQRISTMHQYVNQLAVSRGRRATRAPHARARVIRVIPRDYRFLPKAEQQGIEQVRDVTLKSTTEEFVPTQTMAAHGERDQVKPGLRRGSLRSMHRASDERPTARKQWRDHEWSSPGYAEARSLARRS